MPSWKDSSTALTQSVQYNDADIRRACVLTKFYCQLVHRGEQYLQHRRQNRITVSGPVRDGGQIVRFGVQAGLYCKLVYQAEQYALDGSCELEQHTMFSS